MKIRAFRVDRFRSALLTVALLVPAASVACDGGDGDGAAAKGEGEGEGDGEGDGEGKGEGDADGEGEKQPKAKDGADAAKKDTLAKIEERVEKAVDEAVEEAGAGHLFDPEDKAFRKRACEFLTPDLVAKTFSVPAGELEQFKMMGCMYTRKDGDQITDAKLMMIRVHKTPERATTWFNNATASKTKAQLDAEMELVKERLKEREELDTEMKKKTANSIADMAKMASPDEGITYDDVSGIGDQARVSGSDGALWVRLGNMTFQIQAYQGPDMPQPDFDPKNPRGMAKLAIEAQKKWLADTIDERRAAATKLAPAVVEAIKAG